MSSFFFICVDPTFLFLINIFINVDPPILFLEKICIKLLICQVCRPLDRSRSLRLVTVVDWTLSLFRRYHISFLSSSRPSAFGGLVVIGEWRGKLSPRLGLDSHGERMKREFCLVERRRRMPLGTIKSGRDSRLE
jgi:hypothetical protein